MITVPALFVGSLIAVISAPLWIPVVVIADLVLGRVRLPLLRLGMFGVCWLWIESIGVTVSGALWLCGQRRNLRAHYRLQAWWAAALMTTLQATTGIKVLTRVESLTDQSSPAVMLSRHASLADSLVSAWVITSKAHARPRYVLKRELLVDPCLDIVGGRLPNHFLDRQATDSSTELESLRRLASEMTPGDVAVIFPEGTRSSPAKRAKALASLQVKDPRRAERAASLLHVLPVRPAGARALVDGCPHADVVMAWHTGFDGLDSFGGMIRHLRHRPPPVRFATWRIASGDVPRGEAFVAWLDDQWEHVDREVANALAEERRSSR